MLCISAHERRDFLPQYSAFASYVGAVIKSYMLAGNAWHRTAAISGAVGAYDAGPIECTVAASSAWH